MITEFPYFPKTYEPGGSKTVGVPGAGSTSMSSMLGTAAEGYSPAQQALNIWGTNTSPDEPGWVERWLSSFGSGTPTAPGTTTTPPAGPQTPPGRGKPPSDPLSFDAFLWNLGGTFSPAPARSTGPWDRFGVTEDQYNRAVRDNTTFLFQDPTTGTPIPESNRGAGWEQWI